ncbi:hypothetical protein PR048_027423 [Dryococelus australis]|uniref:Uncharacterized protein n=1 Tax=Dryococelus australis TaxID=614101 RepID=A0ABQ9GFE3_9NEOP|nr:hypothetical protein PR048_027423 [Dryococelus australis]
MKKSLTKWNVLDAIHSIAVSCEKITPQAIVGCFRHAGFRHNDRDVTTENEMDVEDELPGPMFQDFVAVDENVEVCGQMTAAELMSLQRNRRKIPVPRKNRMKPHGQQDRLHWRLTS